MIIDYQMAKQLMMIKIRNLAILSLFIIIACNNTKETSVEESGDTIVQENPVVEEENDLEENFLLIKPNEFYGVKLKDNIDELIARYPQRFEKSVKKSGEGDFVVYKIHSDSAEHLANIYPHMQSENLVGQIEIISSKAKSQDKLGIGDSFKDLSDKAAEVEVHGSEIEGRTYASKMESIIG